MLTTADATQPQEAKGIAITVSKLPWAMRDNTLIYKRTNVTLYNSLTGLHYYNCLTRLHYTPWKALVPHGLVFSGPHFLDSNPRGSLVWLNACGGAPPNPFELANGGYCCWGWPLPTNE